MTHTIITNAQLFDTKAGELVGERHVLVEEGRIKEVSDKPIAASEARVIDARGRTLMPGLCDAHVHVVAGSANVALVESWSPYYRAAKAAEILNGMLMRGFTTVRDAGGADWGLATAVDEDLIAGPRLLYCGPALTPSGGHADFRAMSDTITDPYRTAGGIGRLVDGVPEIKRACRDEIRRGAKHIKLMISGGVASPMDPIDAIQFGADEVEAAVEEAENANLYVAGHGHPARSIKRALKLGLRSIEHCTVMDQECVDLFLANDAWMVPTMAIFEGLHERGPEAGLPPASQAKLAEIRPTAMKSLEMAYKAGVNLAYGTDLLGILHEDQSSEFRIRAEIMKPEDIFRQATSLAAELFRMEGEVGTVEPGARADLLIVDGNPLEDLSLMEGQGQHMMLIMKDGKAYKNELN